MSPDPADLSARELRHLYRTRQLSPVEATRAVLERIGRFDPTVNAFCLIDEERAIAAARASEARWHKGAPCGLVDGVPTTIKDLVLTRDWPTLRGSLAIERDQPWPEDAPATARLREHGAVLIGKTTTPEFGWKAVTDCALTGITRNPWDTGRTPGGSSGGAAVAAALGMGVLHVGSDGGGSIRIPAGFTGIFGLKPSFGRVPAYPASPFGTVAHVGPMTRTVGDAALMLDVLALPDHRDWFALPARRPRLADRPRGRRARAQDRVQPDARLRRGRAGGRRSGGERRRRVRRARRAWSRRSTRALPTRPRSSVPHWYVGAANLLRGFTAEQRARMDAGLQEIAAEGAKIPLMDYLDRGPAPGRARRGDAPLPRELRSAADADPAARGVRGRDRAARPGDPAALVPLGAVLQPVQPDPAAGRLGALRPDRRRPAGRPADRRADARRRAGPARGARLRGGAPLAAARGAARPRPSPPRSPRACRAAAGDGRCDR